MGRGVATELASSGYRVFASSRTVDAADLPDSVIRLPCDHTDSSQVASAFDRIRTDEGRLDVLVNSAWGGYERMVENGEFTWTRPFWDQPSWRWDAMLDAGLRAAFLTTRTVVPIMIGAGSGLVVHVSYWAAQRYLGNVIYGIAKAATDKMTADMAHELAEHGVSVVSLYPGLVRTEAVLEAAAMLDLSNSESPEFIGRAVKALHEDPHIARRSGQVVIAAQLAREYGFVDVDGKLPTPLDADTA